RAGGVPEWVVVDERVGLVHAVRPRRHLFAEATGGVIDHEVDRLLDRVDAGPGDDVSEAVGGELRGADLRPQVADVVGEAVVRRHRVQHVTALDAAVDHLDDGPAGPFPPDGLGGRVFAPGHAAPRLPL